MSKREKPVVMGFARNLPDSGKAHRQNTPQPENTKKMDTPVSIDSDYPSKAALEAMRAVKAPKLKKLTPSLF